MAWTLWSSTERVLLGSWDLYLSSSLLKESFDSLEPCEAQSVEVFRVWRVGLCNGFFFWGSRCKLLWSLVFFFGVIGSSASCYSLEPFSDCWLLCFLERGSLLGGLQHVACLAANGYLLGSRELFLGCPHLTVRFLHPLFDPGVSST